MKKLLLIDDDVLVAKVYRSKFSNEGFEVVIAADGASALRLLQETRPSLAILDLQLPDMPGVELLAQIRGQPEFRALPVIVLTSTFLSNAIQSAWKAGATKCLSKASCSPSQLVAIVKGVLRANEPASVTKPEEAFQSVKPGRESESGEGVSAEARQEFIASLPVTLASLRQRVQLLYKCEDHTQRLEHLEELYRLAHTLTSDAGVTGLTQIAQLSEALEALLKELFDKPRHFTPSTLRTVAGATDFLGVLFGHGNLTEEQSELPLNILVVDDEPLSRRAILYALEKAKLKAVSVDHPDKAYQLLSDNPFDLIFLDVDMPGMSGFELCSRLRGLPGHKKTPVVFVTALSDFDSRAQSTIAGGNDLIAKPFLFVELAVKAMVYILRGRIDAAKRVAGTSQETKR